MSVFGYRVMELFITPQGKMERVPFTEPQSESGLYRALLALFQAVKTDGQRDDSRYRYIRVSEVKNSGWGILLTVKGGDYGEEREIFDVDNGNPDDPPREIRHSDAVLKDFHVLFLVPPYGDSGLIISEIRGRSHPTPALLTQINTKMKAHGIKLRVTSELVDAQAWSEFLEDETVGVTAIELVQSTQSRDRTSFTEENVKSSRLHLSFVDGSEVKRRISSAVRSIKPGGKPPKLAGIVGLKNFTDEDFDEEQVITVQDGRQRKIDVTSSWPKFTYPLDTEDRLNARGFLEAVMSAAQDSFRHLNVDLAADWRPKLPD